MTMARTDGRCLSLKFDICAYRFALNTLGCLRIEQNSGVSILQTIQNKQGGHCVGKQLIEGQKKSTLTTWVGAVARQSRHHALVASLLRSRCTGRRLLAFAAVRRSCSRRFISSMAFVHMS